MQSSLQVYRVTLEVKGPVFIGSGQKLTKKEYIKRGKRVIVPNIQKMFEGFCFKHLENSYEEFLYTSNTLTEWLEEKVKARYLDWDMVEKWKSYGLNNLDEDWDEKSCIDLFIKDAYGLPYIPGSSIKGMLRTILLAYDICKNSGKYQIEEIKKEIEKEIEKEKEKRKEKKSDNKFYLRYHAKQLEDARFNRLQREKGAVYSVMSKIVIGDSEPLGLDDLILCKKQDRSTEMVDNKINTLRECLKPGTKITFPLTIDTKDFPYSIEEIKEAIKMFADLSYDCFLSKFRGTDRPMENTVWLGGGVGYVSKTITYALFQEKGVQRVAEILETNDRKVSPHMLKMTQYQGKDYCFGECRIHFEKQ